MIIKKKSQTRDGEMTQAGEPVVDAEKTGSIDPDKIDLFDLDNIDFKQRQECRRGDRRRGFRRIDDRNLISRAREEAQAIKEAAAQEGYQEGLMQAQADLAQLKESITAFAGAKQEVFEYIAPDILEISVEIAQKIIKKEITQNPDIIMENIMEILKGLSKEETKISIKTNPSQAAMLKQEVPAMLEGVGIEAKIFIIPDENIYEGGCIVTTTNGVIDATIETQLAVVAEALKEV
jgi:flagellar assembly protein FliH